VTIILKNNLFTNINQMMN